MFMSYTMRFNVRHVLLALSITALAASATHAFGEWSATNEDGVVTANYGDSRQLGWQQEPIDRADVTESFLPSAFLHPLRTPAGFEWTAIMPGDHVHHLGLWWPWKYIKVDDQVYNCWELQAGEGAHYAVGSKVLTSGPDALVWKLQNEIRIRKPGENAGPPVKDGITAIHETVHLRIARHGEDANAFDIAIRQSAGDKPVSIEKNHYSGFSWRGPVAWNRDNSEMTTSENHNRDQANGTEGRWVLVTGPAAEGASASVLMMSAAADIAGTPELLRVWDSGMYHGTPFVNFNPVQNQPHLLDDDHPAVSHRQYRVIAADRILTAADAEAEWQAWREAAKK